MNALIIYWSKGGNTEKVALAIQDSLREAGIHVLLKKVEDAGDIDVFAYDLICVGFPSYHWRPPAPIDKFLNSTFKGYRKEGRLKVSAPKVPGKNALILCKKTGQPGTGFLLVSIISPTRSLFLYPGPRTH